VRVVAIVSVKETVNPAATETFGLKVVFIRSLKLRVNALARDDERVTVIVSVREG